MFTRVTGDPVALVVRVSGFAFLHSMEPYSSDRPLEIAKLDYRPREIQVTRGEITNTLHIGWVPFNGMPVAADNGVVSLTVR